MSSAILTLGWRWRGIMFKNHLAIALRNVGKQKWYSVINILGLGIGMACCVLILLFIQDELSYDQFHERKDRIYRLAESATIGGRFLEAAVTPAPWGPALANDYPMVEKALRLKPPGSRWLIRHEDKRFYEKGFYFADSTVFDVLTVPLVLGTPSTALTAPHTVVFSESMAKKYFGGENPIGKNITGDGTYNFTVTGVMRDLPKNSHFQFDFLASYASLAADSLYGEPATFQTQGFNHSFYTYLLLTEGTDPSELQDVFPEFLEKYLGDQLRSFGVVATPFLQPIADIHLHSNIEAELGPNSDITYIYMFSSMAIFMLLIACINFMNLATARSAHRAQEVGIRKVLGAYRSQLISQFVGESLIMSVLALFVALVLVYLLLPFFNELSGKQMVMTYNSAWMIPSLIAIVLGVGIVAGGYPAFFLSSFRPVAVLQGALKAGASNAIMRKVLVVVQFAISIIMIIGTGVVFSQLDYMQNKKLGFEKEHVIVTRLPDADAVAGFPSFKDAIMQYPEILNVSNSTSVPGEVTSVTIINPEGVPPDQSPTYIILSGDYEFLDVMQMEMAEGRYFSKDFPSDSTACVINEETVRSLGWEEPLGKTFRFSGAPDNPPMEVIGVVKDFHMRSLHQAIEPLMMTFPRFGVGPYVSIKTQGKDIQGTLKILQEQWSTVYPNHPVMEYSFLEEDYAKQYEAEQRLGSVFMSVSALTILIACMGLFGLASFMAEQRTKEIGVRKVLGATISDIVMLLSRDFTKLVLISFVVGAPIVYYLMDLWLQAFPYRTEMDPLLFVLAGVGALLISWLTVGYQALRAATTNPADALQYE